MERIIKFFKKPIIINSIIVIICILIFYTILLNNNELIYSMNDDIAMKAITSGKYNGEPSSYMIFSGFPYSILLLLLYKITNKIDWYGLILISSTVFFFGYTIYSVIKNKKETFKKVIYTILIISTFAVVFNVFFVELTFTSIAAFITICCLILYLLPDGKIKNVIMAAGIVLAFGIRAKSCLMILVFFIPALFYKNYRNKEKLKKDFILGIKIGIVLVICIIVEKSAYNNLDWKEYMKYNNYRSLYYDYYFKTIENLPVETKEEIFHNAGFTDSEMQLLSSYGGIALYDNIPTKMENLIEQCKSHNLKLNSNMKETIRIILTSRPNICYCMTLIIIAYLIISSSNKKEKLIKIIPFLALQIAILTYLVVKGRIPDRVIVPIYTCYIVTNIYIILQEEKIQKSINKLLDYNRFTSIMVIILIFILAMDIKVYNNDKVLAEKGSMMEEYFESHPENFYIYDNNYLAKLTLFNRFSKNNYINMNGWTAYSPLHQEAIKRQGASSLKELAFKDNVYIVLLNYSNIELYNEIDTNVKIEMVDSIGEYNIYKFTK